MIQLLSNPINTVAIAKSLRVSFPYLRAYESIEGWGVHFLASMQPIDAATPAEFAPLTRQSGNGTVKLILNQTTNDDTHIFYGAPKGTVAETFTAYSWRP